MKHISNYIKSNQNKPNKKSTRETFDKWMSKCCDKELGTYSFGRTQVLSIAGSDGIDITNTHVGKAPFDRPDLVDIELEREGYYDDGYVNMGEYYYHKPTMKYSEWFYKNFK